jgi:DNA polymerase I
MVIERSRGLTIVRNGELMEIPFPENPYVLCQSSISTNNQKEYTDIYTKEKILLGREEFDDLNDARDFYMAASRRGVYFNSIKDQILLDKPDYFRQFGQTEPVKILRVDIECLSDGSGVFPKPGKVPIIAISVGKRSWPAPAEEPICLMNYQDGEIQDKRILEEFVKIYKDYNPDIVLGYNPWFDIEYIIGRLQKHKMSLSFLTRDGSLPFFQTKEGMRFRLSGRIVMDLYESVKRDQSLSGIKDKKLKTVCAWYKIPAISLDTKDLRPYVNTPQLMEYNISDVRVLDKLTDIYLPLEVQLAEMMGMPLDDVINGFNSSIPKIYTGRRLLAMGFIPLDSNEDRYGDTRFEAAYVDILKTGRFDAIYKLDFASQYPTVMMTFNLGPDTVKMINQEAYDPAKFSVERREDTLHLVIPDENFQKNMIITVDLSKDSFIREDMLRLYKMRAELKKLLKTNVQGTERIALESKSNAVKVLMNTTFGFEGLKYSRFGDMAVAVAIVGISRWLIRSSIEKIRERVVEIDTDGLYLDADVNLEEMNTFIAGLVAEKTGQHCYLKFEKEGPWIGYFYKSKNYALLKGNDIIFHGVAFKSSKYGKIRDRFVNEVARATLMGANDTAVKELVIRLRDLSSYSLEDFMMHISLTKTHYETGSQQDKLIKKIEPILQRKVVAGESIDYYKVPEGYEVSENITTIDQLDKDYYLGVIEKAQEIFGLQDVHKTPEELLEEARKEKKLILMRKKRDLKDYFEGNIMAHPEFGNLSIEAARLEFSRIEDIQECMTKKWPCPACSGLERELRYPEGIECKCGWIGLPPRPPRKTRKKRTDDTRK